MRDLQVQHAGHPISHTVCLRPAQLHDLAVVGGGTRPETIVGMTKIVPIADRLYDEYLIALRKEGLKDG